MADYTSAYTGQQIDNLLGRVSTVEGSVISLSSTVSTLDSAVTNKQDKVAGKGLSTNDYTNGDKAKLNALPTGTEINNALNGKASASSVSAIEAKIPSAASSSNQLADKEYVSTNLSGKASTASVNEIAAKIPSAASSSNQLADKAYVSSGLSGKQSTLVSGTNIKTVNGESILGSGNIIAGDPNAVKYVAQSLTESQKAQARDNIGAASTDELSGRYYGFYTSSSLLPTGTTSGYAFVGASEPFAVWNYDGSSWSDSGATVNAVEGEPGRDGVGFASVTSQQDGTIVITLTNGDSITIDLNHNHPQYPKYVYLTSESQMPASPDSTTLYLILES